MSVLRKASAAVAVVALALAVSTPAIVAGGTTNSTYGPKGGKFKADFPSTPKASGNLSSQLSSVSGAVSGYGYAVTADKRIFDGSTTEITAVPTYEVIVIRFSSVGGADTAVDGVETELAKPKDVTVHGSKGLESVSHVAAQKAKNGAPAQRD